MDFSFFTKPYPHQEQVFHQTKEQPVFAFTWEMGLGKTKIALDTLAYLYGTGRIEKALVITLNGVHRNWVNKEIPTHLNPELKYKAKYWRSSAGMKDFVDHAKHEGLFIATINVEALSTKKGEEFLSAFVDDKCAVIVDESHAFKNPKAQRTKTLLKLASRVRIKRIMTGTPVTKSPLDIYCQYYFLDKNILKEPSYYGFRNKYALLRALPSNPRVKIECGYRNLEELKRLTAPYTSRLTKEQCLDLPKKIYRRQSFLMTEEQEKIYKAVAKRIVLELSSKDGVASTISPQLAIVRMLRLHQISCGFVVSEGADGKREEQYLFTPEKNPRIMALLDILEQVEGRVIIWTTYTNSLREIVSLLASMYGEKSVAGYSGETPQEKRMDIVTRFQDANSGLRFFVGQPKAGGTGITLTAASHVVYYSNDYDLVTRLQSEDRAHRIGQEKPVVYHDIECLDTIDSVIVDALVSKREIASVITGDKLVEWITKE